jgi:hypothetical protein
VPNEIVRPVRGQLHFLEPTNEDTLKNFVGIGIGEYCLIPRITDVGLGGLFERETDCGEILPKYCRHDEKRLWAALDTLLDLSDVNPSELEFAGRMSVGLRPIREGGAGSRRCGKATVWSSTITDMAARALLCHGAVAIKWWI